MLTDIAEEFSTHNSDGENPRSLPVDWNIKPTQDIYIIKSDSTRKIDVVSWGLIAPWSKSGEEALRS
ncbi:MAG: DUF159 family protein, partial [Actinobacteria bacterium]|nr:DUF159 family protein [Actinomycetota bacterium]